MPFHCGRAQASAGSDSSSTASARPQKFCKGARIDPTKAHASNGLSYTYPYLRLVSVAVLAIIHATKTGLVTYLYAV